MSLNTSICRLVQTGSSTRLSGLNESDGTVAHQQCGRAQTELGHWTLNTHLLVVGDVFVGHARQKLLEVLSLVALPALPVGLQVCVETLHLVLAFLHLDWHLRRHREKLQLGGGGIIQDYR